jgi:hypothetical protein
MYVMFQQRRKCQTFFYHSIFQFTSNMIRIILVRHTSYNEDDLEAPSSAINK